MCEGMDLGKNNSKCKIKLHDKVHMVKAYVMKRIT